MGKMMKKLALLLCIILTVNSVLIDATITVNAEPVVASATVSFTYDDTSLAYGEVQWKNGDGEWHTQSEPEENVGATQLRIKYSNDGTLAGHTALRVGGNDIISDSMSALESEEGLNLEAGVNYEFEHIEFVAPQGDEGGPEGPGGELESGDIQININNGQNGIIEYKIDGGDWIEIDGNRFTLRKKSELKDVVEGTNIYFKATPNEEQNLDANMGQNRVRFDGEDHDISVEDLSSGSFFIQYNSEKMYSIQLAFEGNGEPSILPEITDPYEISIFASGYEENFFDQYSPIRVDGYDVRDGKVIVNKAETHTIEVQIAFGAGLSKFIVNGTEYEFSYLGEDRYSVAVAEADSYTITLEKGEAHSVSIVWNYDREEAIKKYGNDDAWVENGRVELVSIKRGEEIIYDEANAYEGYKPEENGISIREDGGDIFLEKGDDVVLRLIPNYEHQLASVNINGVDELKPEESVSTFSIDNIQGNIHFKGVFKHADDIIKNNSEVVGGGNIADGENAAESGNLQLTINDNSGYTKDVTGAVDGDNIEKVASIDLELENIVSKGSEGAYWNSDITTFDNDIRVAFDIDFSKLSEGEEFSVVRDHDGKLEELEVICDFEHGVIDFPTNKFSTYTIVKKDVPKSDITDEMWIWDPSIEKYVYIIDDKNPCDEFTNIYVPSDKVLVIAKDYKIAGNLTVDIFGTLQIEKGCKLTVKEGANLDMCNLSCLKLGDSASKDLFTPLKVKKTGYQELINFEAPEYIIDNAEFTLIDGKYVYYDGPDSGFNLNTNGTIVPRDEEGNEGERRGTIDYKVTTDGEIVAEGVLLNDWDEVDILPEKFKVGTVVEFTVHVNSGYTMQSNGVRFPNNKNTISKKEDEDKSIITCSYTLDEEPSGFLMLTVDFIRPGEEREYAEFCWSYDSDVTKTDGGWDKFIEHGTVEIVSVTKNGSDVTNGTLETPPYWSTGESFEQREEDGIRWNEKVAIFEEGTTVVAKLIPDRGYQLTRFNISNIAKTTKAVDGVNEYTFYLDRPDIYHLSAVFSPVDDEVDTSSATGISGGNVTFAADEVANGTMALNVSDVEPSEIEMNKFNEMAEAKGFSIAQCLNLESEQRFYKGVEDATRDQCWVINKSELSKPANIELESSDIEADEVLILHNHNGEYEEIPATIKDGKITFEAQSFSDFAIVTKTNCNHPDDKIVTEHKVPATCETTGLDVKKCTECGKKVGEEKVVPALGHVYVDGVCSRCSVISLKLCKDISIDAKSVLFNDTAQVPEVTVTYKGTVLNKGTDYTLVVDSKTAIGTYELTVEGIGKYRDIVKERWSILPTSGLYCEVIPDQFYTGKAIKPEVEVYSDGMLLTLGKDYTVSYGKYNTNVATKDAMSNGKSVAPSVTITGKGNYSDKKIVTFSIVQCQIDTADVQDIVVVKSKSAIKINPVVTLAGKKLKLGTDYVISTSTSLKDEVTSYKDAGEYSLWVVGKNNYAGAVPFKFTITEKTLAGKVTVKKIPDQKYNAGNEVRPELEVTYKIGGKVTNVTDNFTVKYVNNTEIGTATAIITAKPESTLFAGSKAVTFKITGEQIKNAKLGADGRGTIPSKIYDGNPYEPVLNLYVGATPLIRDVDYTVTYSKNVNVGTATAKVTGIGKYTGTKNFSYKITQYSAADDASKVITIDDGAAIIVAYEKGGVTPKPVIKMNGVILQEKKDYTLSYANNKGVAKADATNPSGKSIAPKITVTFKGNLSGKKTVNFEIKNKDIGAGKITIADKAVGGKPNAWKQTAVTIVDTNGKKLVAGTDYNKTFKYYSNPECTSEITADTLGANTTVYVKVDGIKNYDKSIVGCYRISEKNISKVSASIEPQIFTGSAICPSVSDIKVWTGSGKNKTELKAGVDYDIVSGSYTNNVNKGTATVTIVGKGDYYGTKVVKFTIGVKKLLWWE